MPRRDRKEGETAGEPASVHGFLDEIEAKDGRRPRRRTRDDELDLDLDRIW